MHDTVEEAFPMPENELSKEMSPGSDAGYRIFPGACWITPEGQTYRISGFHENWLASHPELSKGARDVAHFVQATGWAAVTLYSEASLELILADGSDPETRNLVTQILERNRGRWMKAQIYSLDRDGVVLFDEGMADGLTAPASLGALLDRLWPALLQ